MTSFSSILKLFSLVAFIYLCYRCCSKSRRRRATSGEDVNLEISRSGVGGGSSRPGANNNGAYSNASSVPNNNGGGTTFGAVTDSTGGGGISSVGPTTSRIRINRQSPQDQTRVMDPATAAARKSLVQKSLFRRTIQREESIRELSQLLAISRGNTVLEDDCPEDCVQNFTLKNDNANNNCANDADTGVVEAISRGNSMMMEENYVAIVADVSDTGSVDVEMGGKDVMDEKSPSSSSSALPAPSAPSISMTDVASTPSNANNEKNTESNIPTTNPVGGVIRTFLDGWTRPSTATDEKLQCRSQHRPKSQLQTYHFECSICLERFVPNDIISWAKDGGESSTGNSTNSDSNDNEIQQACDHIFHEECLLTWLQHHDECPLCRRKVVHEDAEVRFAAWNER